MFDSTRFKHYSLRSFDYRELRERGAITVGGRFGPAYILPPPVDNIALPRISIYRDYSARTHIEARVSLPNLLFGHNASLPEPDDVYTGLQCMSDYISERTGRYFDAFTAIVTQIDYCTDIHVGEENLMSELKKLASRRLSRCIRQFFENTTLYFTSKSRKYQVRIYSKLDEVLANRPSNSHAIEAARGNLRFEICLRDKRTVVQRTKRLHPRAFTAAEMFTQDLSDRIFQDLFQRLTWAPALPDQVNPLELILKKYRSNHGLALFGFVQAINHYGADPTRLSLLGISRSTYYRNQRQLKECGITI
ncbi:MAG: phage/plasmid replication protein [Pyrinomonadaceae bacterium]